MTVTAPALSRTVRAAAGRLSWGLVDQAVSSLTNFAVGIVVARSLGVTEFGAFSLAWVTYGVVLNLSRGLATDPLVVRFSAVPVARWRAAVSRSSGTALVIGLVTGAGCAGIGLVVGGSVGTAFVGLGLVLPAVALQDSWRFAFFAAGQPRRAVTNDLVWAATLVPSMFVVAGHPSVPGFVLAWGLSGAVAACFGCLQIRLLPGVGGVRGWLRRQRDLGVRYMIENVSSSGAAQLRMYGLGAIAGLAAVGTVRGAELLLGPFLAVLMGLSQVAVPEAARVLRRSPHRLSVFCLLLGGAQAVAALSWGLALLFLLPDGGGERVLGALWAPASALILPATLAVMNASFFTGAAAGVRALGAARRSLRAQLLASGGYVTGGLVGAAMNGALGSAWGVALGTGFGVAVWWFQLREGLAERPASTGSTRSDPPMSHENEGTPTP
ncbi:hypothetical protein [Pseudonocardia asaccharolytica]|uniref:Membrane protein n=1 Tax=Pseudonocardia asaccharolytica DSM 44247 = NBRC 16224 TaxID=1123024 RepID=A0A511DAX4_9PSEU|nr:hypothetical protein [Pseudonocardia asaccharolytica]GEL20814.1 membrane protein [Pseudonocardia asaccharolytica DSM 44247 = NBRC 16224]